MSNLVIELLLRLLKPLIAVILGAIVYVVAVALGEPGSISLALLSFLCRSRVHAARPGEHDLAGSRAEAPGDRRPEESVRSPAVVVQFPFCGRREVAQGSCGSRRSQTISLDQPCVAVPQ